MQECTLQDLGRAYIWCLFFQWKYIKDNFWNLESITRPLSYANWNDCSERNNIEEQLGVVRIENGLTDFFYLKSGLRQGCVLSPTLFTIIIDFVSRHCRFRGGIELCPRQSLQDGNFVDDVALISRFQEEASISYFQEDMQNLLWLRPGNYIIETVD